MPVWRYRSVSDMPPPPRATDADLALRIRAVMSRAVRMAKSGCPPGVQRFRSVEEAARARAAMIAARVRRVT